ncbi:MAG: sel1 repeat family protein [Betaproteobacteria bacterium]|nr:sel1 repeat family protein [Betaproteobacteria bacterium]
MIRAKTSSPSQSTQAPSRLAWQLPVKSERDRLKSWLRRLLSSFRRMFLAGMLLSASFVLLASCSDYNDARSAYAGGRHQEAFVKLLKLAKEGHLKAQYEVAMMLNNGIGVAKDKEEAWNWFVRAAKAGNIDAQVELGAVITAKDHLRNLRELMSEPDLAKAERIKDGLLKDESSAAKG